MGSSSIGDRLGSTFIREPLDHLSNLSRSNKSMICAFLKLKRLAARCNWRLAIQLIAFKLTAEWRLTSQHPLSAQGAARAQLLNQLAYF